ncbi:hypothetical protein BTA51_17820 [Hahella sp. CCB-MM4]|uniref:hypothetical protein n=1 Tax=Hahella sp. (strain CCB-MM4) TaxID=1926491 RepID=UPI000B9C60A8|nr:hypothetical protein [Hahella sp. CCB-MM4]OZG71867.1 hypothetical protein BTA51_17820 [Hahella sp. CCB-MM4]
MYHQSRLGRDETSRERLEKQLFRDVQRLIRYLDSRKQLSSVDSSLMADYERMILERCEVLGEISRR